MQSDRGFYQTANLFVRRETFDAVGGFRDWVLEQRPDRRWSGDTRRGRAMRTPIGEDTDFAWRARRLSAVVAFAAEALVHHAVVPGTVSDAIADRWHWARDMAGLARLVPELRQTAFYRRVFFNQVSARFDLALAGLAIATLTREAGWTVAGMPYIRHLRGVSSQWGRAEAITYILGAPLLDAVTLAGLHHRQPDVAQPRPLRILAVGNMYPPHHAGGYELMWEQAMRRRGELGHTVRVLTTDYWISPDTPSTTRTCTGRCAGTGTSIAMSSRSSTSGSASSYERHNADALHLHLEEFQPDVVAWWSMGCVSLGLIERVRRAGLPASFVVHDDWLIYGRRLNSGCACGGAERRFMAPVVSACSGFPTTSIWLAGPMGLQLPLHARAAREPALTPAPGVTVVVPPGIEEHFLEPVTPQPWRWRLVYVGRLDRQKGVDTAIAGAAPLPTEQPSASGAQGITSTWPT